MIQTETLPNKLMPNNIEAEQAVLGGIIIDAAYIHRVKLNASEFYLEKHGMIWNALRALVSRDEAIDNLTVVNELMATGKLNDVGGAAYIVSLINSVPSAVNVESYAKIVSKLATLRRLIMAAGDIAGLAYDGADSDIDATITKAQTALLKASPVNHTTTQTSDDAMADLMLEFNVRVVEPRDFVGLRSGLLDWDKEFGGLVPGLYVLAGQSSHGKTAVALALADGIASDHKRGIFLSMEMTQREINLRRLARQSGIATDEIDSGYIDFGKPSRRKFNPLECKTVRDAAEKLAERPLVFRNEYGISSARACSILADEQMRNGLDFAVIDYLHLFTDEGDNDVKMLGEATKNLKQAANNLNIPIILLCQVHRGVENRDTHVLTMSDLRGSGRIEENADLIFGVTNEDNYHTFQKDYQKENIVDVYCIKDRITRARGHSIELTWIERTGAVQNKANGVR